MEPLEPQKPERTEEERGSHVSDVDEAHKEKADHTENVERRSTREKTRSKRLTYPSLGNPLVEVMQSLLKGLDKAFIAQSFHC